MFRKSKTLICAFLILLVCFCIPFESKAVNNEFFVPYSEPTCDSHSGYFSVISNSGDGTLYTYFWNMYADWNEVGQPPSFEMYITVNSNSVVFHPYSYGTSNTYLTLGYYDASGNIHMIYYGSIGLNTYSRTETFGQGISGYCFGGNATGFNGSYKDVLVPIIHWNDSPSATELRTSLFNVLLRLNDIKGDTSTIITKLEYIYNQNVATNQKLDNMTALLEEIKVEQEESNTWLEKIFNWLKDSPEQEKQEATTQGNQSTSDATTAITDNSQGFIDSLGGLADSMSYSGTDCAWTFPAITLPAIPGVMDSMQLTTEKPIDFSYWVNQIPENLLLLIQSLLTIALIIYCFKEVYGTISYVLTLRGGGNNE